MALSGVHVACCPVFNLNNASLVGRPTWSQTLASAGTTTNAAPDGPSVFVIRAASDVYVAMGAAPDASQTTGSGDAARTFVEANATQTFAASAGQKLAWVAA